MQYPTDEEVLLVRINPALVAILIDILVDRRNSVQTASPEYERQVPEFFREAHSSCRKHLTGFLDPLEMTSWFDHRIPVPASQFDDGTAFRSQAVAQSSFPSRTSSSARV